MDAKIGSLNTESIIAAIENNLFACIAANRYWPQATVRSDDEVLWVMTPYPYTLFNVVMGAHVAPDDVDRLITSAIAEAQQRNIPILWWTSPQTHPANLAERLLAFGFTYEGESPGMALDMAQMNIPPASPPGLDIRRVHGAQAQREWCQLSLTGFEMEDAEIMAGPFADFLSHVDPDTFVTYLGLMDGLPVATSMLIMAAGAAGIYNVATLPSARGRGIGTAMTIRPLLDACAMGYRVGVLHASEMGAPVYRRLGFREYCRLGQYVWTPT